MRKNIRMFLLPIILCLGIVLALTSPITLFAQVGVGEPVTKETLNSLDPLVLEDSPQAVRDQLSTPGGILSRLINNYGIPAAGMILFVMIVWGGFEMMTSSVGSKKNAGRERIQAAIIGFILLFSAYWIGQLIQAIFGVKFL